MRNELYDDWRQRQYPSKHSAQTEVVYLALVMNLDVHRKARFEFFLVHSETDLPSENKGVRGALNENSD